MMSRSAEFSRSARDLREFLDYELAKRTYGSRPSSEWYTQPIHKTLPERPKVTFSNNNKPRMSSSEPSFHKLPVDVSSVKRVNGLGPDEYAAEFFPATMSAPYTLQMTPKPTLANCPKPEGLPRPVEAWRPGSPTRSTRSKRPASSRSMDGIDKMHIMADEMPITATSTVVLATPYQMNLAKLRLERLRIEESHLLEVKRLEELERIRGPRPKWYEMKTPEFHYESHKNTELVKSRKDYQALYDYRMRLVKASRDFEFETALRS